MSFIVTNSYSVVPFRDFLQRIPELHLHVCSNCSGDCIQKGQDGLPSYFFLKFSLIPTLALNTMRAISGLTLVIGMVLLCV